MNPADNLERLIEKYLLANKSGVRTGAEFDEKVHADIQKSLEEQDQTRSAPAEPNTWRTIMTSTIAKLAAAAVIIIAVLAAVIVFTGPAQEPPAPIANDTNHKPPRNAQGDTLGVPRNLDETLKAEAEQIEKMYAAGDVDGLVAMLDKGQFKSKLLAAGYLAQIGDESALPALRSMLASDANLPEDNAFAEAIEAIEAGASGSNIPDTNGASADQNTTLVAGDEPSQPAGAELLELVPADSVFCVRVNNFDYALGMMDQFLAGISPVPAAATMGGRMLIAGLVGDPALNGVNTGGNFAMFAVATGGQSAENPLDNIFIGMLAPVPDFAKFVADNANCGEPDANGICVIKTGGTAQPDKKTLAAQLGGYVLFALTNQYDGLLATKKSICSAAPALAVSLDAGEVQAARTEPIWAYTNIPLASKVFGPFLTAQLEQIRKQLEALNAQGQGVGAAEIIDMYFGILDVVAGEVEFVSLALEPKPELFKLRVNFRAVPETYMAKMLAADTSAEQNTLLGYLPDGAILSLGAKMNTAFWEELSLCQYDLLAFLSKDAISAEVADKMQNLVADMISGAGGPGVVSFVLNPKGQPLFAVHYVIEVKDPQRWNRAVEGSMDLWNTSGWADIYRRLGAETAYEFTRSADAYKDVAIDHARFIMKAVDANSQQGQMLDKLYGSGFDFRIAMVDQLWLCVFGGDCDQGIRDLIDQVKSGGPDGLSPQIENTLANLPGADKAELLGTFNVLRYISFAAATMYSMQGNEAVGSALLKIGAETGGNVAFAGKVVDGKMAFELAVPKEHLMQVITAGQAMAQNVGMLEVRRQAISQITAGAGVEPNMPADYYLAAELDTVCDEDRAIEGLRTFAELSGGKYPGRLDLSTAMPEAARALRSTLAQDPNWDPNAPVISEEIMADLADIQACCLFYDQLNKDSNEVAYYGDVVTADFAHAVLLRWKVADDQYRVIFADLTADTVGAEKLAELEAAPLNPTSTAVRPQPPNGQQAGSITELQLSWLPGVNAASHIVYLGTDAKNLSLLAQVTTDYYRPVPQLEKDTVYYWCVDEVLSDGSVVSGRLWSFRTGKLTAWWKFDEGAGTDAADSSGSGYTGKVKLVSATEPTDTAWDALGRDGGCINFDGNTEVIIPPQAFVNFTTSMTVSLWVNGNVDTQLDPNYWGMPFHAGSGYNNWIFYCHIPTPSGEVMFESGAYRAQRLTWQDPQPEDWKGQWNHYAFALDAQAGLARIYHNGKVVAQTTGGDRKVVSGIQSFTIGCGHFNNGLRFPYKGRLDDVQIYNYALSEAEVTQIYSSPGTALKKVVLPGQ